MRYEPPQKNRFVKYQKVLIITPRKHHVGPRIVVFKKCQNCGKKLTKIRRIGTLNDSRICESNGCVFRIDLEKVKTWRAI